VTLELARAARRIDVAPARGLSKHPVRQVLAAMAGIAKEDGSMRYGLPISTLVDKTGYAKATVIRARNWLLDHGFIERRKRGGGRKSSEWRVLVEKLFPRLTAALAVAAPDDDSPGAGDSSGLDVGHELSHDETGQAHEQVSEGSSSPNPRDAGVSSSPAGSPPAPVGERCRHNRLECRACRTNPRARRKAERKAAEHRGRTCTMCVEAGVGRNGTIWARVTPGTRTPLSPDQPCDHHTPTQVPDQPSAGSGKALALEVARTLPATYARSSRRDWRGRRTTERTSQ
jgi:hypothetical protein